MAFIDKILIPSDKNNFLNEFMTFQRMIADYAVYNSLSQVLIKATAPGFPDMYQGSEFWDFNLVDPDNRRPVDFELRTWLFRELKAKDAEDSMKLINELFSTRKDGRIKLYLMYKALAARIKYKSLFEKGSYIPVETDGTYKNHIIAFARERRPSFSITVAPRFLTGVVKQGVKPLGREVWKDTRIILPEGTPVSWKDVITGTEIRGKKKLFVGDIIKHFPASLLVSNTKK
jgi:(1->4)-alpha-D-glucan 1-alpha-D-glucosylmutase